MSSDRRLRFAAVAIGVGALLAVANDVLPNGLPPGVIVRGVVYGSIDGMVALGLVLVHRSNRIVNFAASALGGVGGVLAVQLFHQFGWPWPLAIALALVVGLATGAGVATFVIRRFARSTRLVLTVATIGLTQVLGGAVLFLPQLVGGKVVLLGGFNTPFSNHIQLGADLVTGDQLLALAVAPIVIGTLAWFLLRTDAGVAIRAAADDADRARTLGIPVRRLEVLVWSIAGVLSTLGFVLRAPFAGVAPTDLAGPQVLLPALAAAVVARMESLPIAFAAALGLGVLDQTVLWNVTGKTSLSSVTFLVVILGVLLLRKRPTGKAAVAAASAWTEQAAGRPLPARVDTLPELRVARAALVGVVVVGAIAAPLLADQGTIVLYSAAVIWGIVALSLVVLTGWNGNISLGQFALVGVGATVAGNLMSRWSVDLFQSLAIAALAGAAAAALVGVPALRVRGLLLAVTTLALAVTLDGFVLNPVNFAALVPARVERPVLWGRIDLSTETAFYYLCLVLLVAVIGVVRSVRRAHAGRALVAVRDDAKAAAAIGLPGVRTTLGAFLLAGALAGLAGGLHVSLLRGAGSGTYPPIASIDVFATAVIGGLGSIGGALSGVVAFRLLAQVVSPQVRLALTGTGLLVVLWLVPGGFAQLGMRLRDAFAARVARRRGVPWGDDAGAGSEGAPIETVDATLEVTTAAPLLRCRGVEVRYGSLQVLFGLDLDVAEGELVALLGTNGSGKSTLLRAVCGLAPTSGGSVQFDGNDVAKTPTEALAARGVQLVAGGKGVFPTLSVGENLRVAGWLLRRDDAARRAAVDEALRRFPPLAARLHTAAAELSGGEQQMLALAMALETRPRLLLIDELSLGLAPTVVGQLMEVVRGLHAEGVTIVVVEQSLNVALELAERAAFLEKGRFRFAGATVELRDRPDVLRSVFLAGAATTSAAAGRSIPVTAPPVLECRGVTKHFGGVAALRDVDLTVLPGQIVGLLGANGAGKSTLLDCISGLLTLDAGQVTVNGVEARDLPPHQRVRLGLGRSMQDAHLFPTLTVREVLALGFEPHLQCRSLAAAALRQPVVDEAEWRLAARVDELVELFGLARWEDVPVAELSTGTRRVVQLACLVAAEPSVVLLDEPAGGLAQREVEALVPVLRRVQERTGCALVVVEHDVPLLRDLCDEIVALEAGEVIAAGPPDVVLAHPRVVASYLGDQLAAIERSGTRTRPPVPA